MQDADFGNWIDTGVWNCKFDMLPSSKLYIKLFIWAKMNEK